MILVRTHIGYGLPHKQDTAEAHGEPPGDEELNAAKENLGWPVEPRFYVPEEALVIFRQAVERGKQLEEDWLTRLKAYWEEFPDTAADLERRLAGELPQGWDADLLFFPRRSQRNCFSSCFWKSPNEL